MDALETAHFLRRAGRFAKALASLASATASQQLRPDIQVLKLELLERLGQHRQSLTLATTLLKSKTLSRSLASACEYVVGRIACEEGDTDRGISHLQRAIS